MEIRKILERIDALRVLPGYEDQLKPCPFCGSKAFVLYDVGSCGYGVACNAEGKGNMCRALLSCRYGSSDLAIAQWNKRVKE